MQMESGYTKTSTFSHLNQNLSFAPLGCTVYFRRGAAPVWFFRSLSPLGCTCFVFLSPLGCTCCWLICAVGLHLFSFVFSPLGCTFWVFSFFVPLGCACAPPQITLWDTRLPCRVIWNWKFPKFNSIQKFPKHLNPTKTFYKSPKKQQGFQTTKIHNTIKIQKTKSKNSNHAKSKIHFLL